mmetsp:Transcript_5143/g.5669  ORF Transcript_5143/g.5669 Transcript_5143/m.5669 type:complete len:106 (+) Transcript_5143:1710-2027(+)
MSEEGQQLPTTQDDDSISINNAVDGAADAERTNVNDPANNNSSNDHVNNSSSNAVDFSVVHIDEKRFFGGLQDEGKQLTPDEIKKETKKRGCIMLGQCSEGWIQR